MGNSRSCSGSTVPCHRSSTRRGCCQTSNASSDQPKQNADGSVDVWFGPKAPPGMENNWAQTIPGKGWFMILRLYGPLQPFFDHPWKPDDIVKIG
ncbi:DUF1214 domain-containing protein [Synechococcus sp. J7-Johnson]|uniref:DUF1214 domain-containing protein n=1 Tax=Synechococcus sp. J7-Johnson TaxID=2823737 RepID=UPI0020CD7C18|nr:DUF1214 domain-containing protein [Synechococcus sp. J7-Johnson]